MLQRVDRKERGAAASVAAMPHLRRLLEATFFQAHSAQRRIIDDDQLEAAALDLHDPGALAALRWPTYDGEASAGHYVQILSGEHTGRFSTVTRVNARAECAVELEDGRRVAWVRVKSSGLGKAAFLAAYGDDARSKKVRAAVEALGVEMKDALHTIRERVAQDRLPLLSLLQVRVASTVVSTLMHMYASSTTLLTLLTLLTPLAALSLSLSASGGSARGAVVAPLLPGVLCGECHLQGLAPLQGRNLAVAVAGVVGQRSAPRQRDGRGVWAWAARVDGRGPPICWLFCWPPGVGR